MRFNLYRSDVTSHWPEEGNGHRYAFMPIAGIVHRHAGTDLITGSETDAAEPFAEIDAPDGSELAESRVYDTLLYLPGRLAGMTATEAYHVAAEGLDGLKLLTLQETR